MNKIQFGKTGLMVSRIALGGYPFGGINKAVKWDPFTPDGRKTAIKTIHAALDQGINYFDTAPSYGNGNSESIIGEALVGRRDQCFLATKVGYNGLSPKDVESSVEASLKRLRTNYVDVIQFHGGMYEISDVNHIIKDGLLDALESMRKKGMIRFIGFTTEEAFTGRAFIACGRFDMMQVCYNLIYQSAALHALNEAQKATMGVTVMRAMTSGILQRLSSYIAPEWQNAHDLYDASLKFVLSDSRVQMANVGMRWPEEVKKNITLVDSFNPAFDMAELPRWTAEIYRTDDLMHVNSGK
jgi:aryl-alcohol dehydrogenase-like predicted oxidoreductase